MNAHYVCLMNFCEYRSWAQERDFSERYLVVFSAQIKDLVLFLGLVFRLLYLVGILCTHCLKSCYLKVTYVCKGFGSFDFEYYCVRRCIPCTFPMPFKSWLLKNVQDSTKRDYSLWRALGGLVAWSTGSFCLYIRFLSWFPEANLRLCISSSAWAADPWQTSMSDFYPSFFYPSCALDVRVPLGSQCFSHR